MLPQAEHRQCARHIAQNFKKKFPGAPFENLFWKACNATTESKFKEVMEHLELLCQLAHNYLMDKDPKTWSRAYYETGRCCDAVENGGNESFNAVIDDSRKKPIISMLEDIRMYMMDKLYQGPFKAWSAEVSPSIKGKLNELKHDQRNWQVYPSGMDQFECKSGVESYKVDLENKTCDCRLWQLNGFGCVHSVAAILFLNREVESYVDPMFKRPMYLKTYQHRIQPLNGQALWPRSNYTPPLPPMARRMPGRPKTKRRKDASENVGKHRMRKVGKKVTCGICAQQGHNKRGCPTVNRPGKLPVKRGKTRSQVC